MIQPTPPFPQNPAHGNGTCEQCGEPCAVCGPRYCPACYPEATRRDMQRFDAERGQRVPRL